MEHKLWTDWQFVLGDWVGEGGGQPGQGEATFTFCPDLEGCALVRKSRMEFAASANRPAFVHEDLIVVYQQANIATRALYLDNEEHVIHYTVDAGNEGPVIRFVSDPVPGAPRFRLTYEPAGVDRLVTRFEIAPPGQPEAFSVYVEGTARRR